MTLKLAWGITGSGDYMVETVDTMMNLQSRHGLEIDVILSQAGKLVVTWYKLWDKLRQNFAKIFVESSANTPFLIGPLQLGKYDFLLVCPATANTTAKIAYGIADSLLTNCVSQAMKAKVPVYIFPVDQRPGEIQTSLPGGKKIVLQMREVDIENVGRLRNMKDLTVLSSPNEIESVVQQFMQKSEGSS